MAGVEKFRKRPVIVEAIQFTGSNRAEVEQFIRGAGYYVPPLSDPMIQNLEGVILIHTLEGEMYTRPRDWVIKGVNGEFYPCKPDIFEKTYLQVGVEE